VYWGRIDLKIQVLLPKNFLKFVILPENLHAIDFYTTSKYIAVGTEREIIEQPEGSLLKKEVL
jgi:hypothetical protein